ncbi:MAG TPA: hypothetical protein VL593_15210, partial [Ramlibacter sp.]|nr:hypothetical protein [Ramlibacter sp.]
APQETSSAGTRPPGRRCDRARRPTHASICTPLALNLSENICDDMTKFRADENLWFRFTEATFDRFKRWQKF